MKFLKDFFRIGVNTTTFLGSLSKAPAGVVADNTGMWGLFGLIANLDGVDNDIVALASGTTTSITLTAAQMAANILDHSGSPGGPVTVTTPTAAQIIAALPNTIPGDGYNASFFYLNDTLGQTVTLNGGTGVTVVGNNTMATATTRFFVMVVNVNAGTVTLVNLGTMNL